MGTIVNVVVLFLIISDVQFLLASEEITRSIDVELPGMEKISKRSLSEDDVEDVITILASRSEKKRTQEPHEALPEAPPAKVKDVFIPTESNDALQPVTHNSYRVGRAKSSDGGDSDVDEDTSQHLDTENRREIRSALVNDDLDTAANIVFRPNFRRRTGFRRYTRSLKQEDELNRGIRSAADLEDLETAANIVFRPNFRRRSGFRRFTRSLSTDLEDLDTAANIVFRPNFRRHNGFRRFKRSPEQDDLDTDANIISTRKIREAFKGSDYLDDLDTAANIVFRPNFRRHSGFRRFKRSADQAEELASDDLDRRYKRSQNEADLDDLDTDSQRFMPSFRRRNSFRRFKRSVNQDQARNELEDLDTAAFVFMPSFRRHGLRRFKRDAIDVSPKTEDLDTAEFVFRPSFNRHRGPRRFRRSSNQEDALKDLDTAEFVFMPSFKRGRGLRRLKRSADQGNGVAVATGDALEDLDTAAFVFMPSFRRHGFRRVGNQ